MFLCYPSLLTKFSSSKNDSIRWTCGTLPLPNQRNSNRNQSLIDFGKSINSSLQHCYDFRGIPTTEEGCSRAKNKHTSVGNALASVYLVQYPAALFIWLESRESNQFPAGGSNFQALERVSIEAFCTRMKKARMCHGVVKVLGKLGPISFCDKRCPFLWRVDCQCWFGSFGLFVPVNKRYWNFQSNSEVFRYS